MNCPGEYCLMFVMPEISRTYFLTLSREEQKSVKNEVVQEIRDTVDVNLLQQWTWTETKILADEDGYKTEEEVRVELTNLVGQLGVGENRIAVPDGALPAVMGGDKRPDCGASVHFAYTLHISRAQK